MTVDTHNLLVDFGRHKGQRWTRVPISYLKWIANTPTHRAHDIAKSELARRGTTTPDFDVSGHAIDRASQTCIGLWRKTALPGEGLHAWLCRLAGEALASDKTDATKIDYGGITWVFERDETVWPVLKTVLRDK